ncbi:hypothetical protein MMC08_007916 [Hypocenomyce scalaris]|nr:hypothetical protein [Hypocenomyce scalaris]
MRFLCLHGKGTSASIFKSQTATFRPRLPSTYTFDFVDAPFTSAPAAGIDVFYSPPYYAFWHGTSVSAIRASHAWFAEILERQGPYDGVMGFSQGTGLIGSFLLYHQLERPGEPLPFKCAVFFCGGVSLNVVADLGVRVGAAARELDERTKEALQEKAASVKDAKVGDDYWARGLVFDPGEEVDRSDVYGLDFTRVSAGLVVNIPTVHVWGHKDPRYPASVQLAQFCEPSLRKTMDHGGGHDIPRTREVSEGIAELVEWVGMMAEG